MAAREIKTLPGDPPPRRAWQMALGGVGAVAAITLAAALLLARGAADPPVAGPLAWADRTLGWAPGPILAADRDVWTAAPVAVAADSPFTLEVRARLAADAAPGAAWGVWLEAADGSRVVYAISGEGYVTARACPASDPPPAAIEECPAVRPEWRWAAYPRIRPPGETNAIALHREAAGAVRLRVNGERLGATPVMASGRWGVWARGGRAGAARVEWARATVWLAS